MLILVSIELDYSNILIKKKQLALVVSVKMGFWFDIGVLVSKKVRTKVRVLCTSWNV